MTLPSSPPITLLQIQTEFGGPGNLLSYYAGGGHVQAGAANGTGILIPSSGTITIEDFLGASAFTAFTTNFTTPGLNTITIPTNASIMTLEVFGGGGGGSASSATVPGDGGSSGGRCVSTFAISPSNWGQTVAMHLAAVGPAGDTAFTSTVNSGTFTLTTMTALGGAGADAGGGGNSSGGNVDNTTGNAGTPGVKAGAVGLGSLISGGISGSNGADGALAAGGGHPATLGTIGHGNVRFS